MQIYIKSIAVVSYWIIWNKSNDIYIIYNKSNDIY